MIQSGLHYYSASQSKRKLKEERVSRLAEIIADYKKSVIDLRAFQQDTSKRLAATLIEDVLEELQNISRPIFRSLTQLDVDYLAFRMQQMAVLSEAILALRDVKENVKNLIVSKEITAIFDELKIASLEIGNDFGHPEPAEQLNVKIESLKQSSLDQFYAFMRSYKHKIQLKRQAIEDLSKKIRQTELETGVTLQESVDFGKAALFANNQGVSMPMTQVSAMIDCEEEF